jgi:hypothetical protein
VATAPGPEQRRLESLVGRWKTEGWTRETPEAEAQRIGAFDTYEWLHGGFALLHLVDARVGDEKVDGAEIIGFDPERGLYATQYFGSDGPTAYEAELEDQGRRCRVADEERERPLHRHLRRRSQRHHGALGAARRSGKLARLDGHHPHEAADPVSESQDLLRPGEGRFWRGNLHCHSDRSDGMRTPREVVAAYRDAGYDFIALSDHFEEQYGWHITDTRDLRADDFTTLVGAELSSGPWSDRTTYWVAAMGLPVDFDTPPIGDPAETIGWAHDAGAFVVLLHPGLNNLPLGVVDRLPAFEAVDAVEIYNHNTFRSQPDRADGAYMVDGLLERGRRMSITAGDDAHFEYPGDRFGGWVEVWAESLEPAALLAGLKSGSYYATQGPEIRRLDRDGEQLQVATSPAHTIALGGAGDRWLDATTVLDKNGGLVSDATFDLSAFRESYCRVTVVDTDGRRAWSNPIWP